MEETIRDDTITVGTSFVEVSPRADYGERVEISITNTSTGGQVISIAWGAPAVAGSGVVLYPTGTFSASVDSATELSNLKITAVASLAGGTIAIHERRIPGRAFRRWF